AFVREMWRLVRDGGRLAITTWGPQLWEPGSRVFWDSVRQVRPELYKAFNPWDEITTPDALAALLADGGVGVADVLPLAGRQRLGRPAHCWDVVLGSGYRATIDALDDAEREAVRLAIVEELRRREVTEIRTDAVLATATKASR